MIEKKATKSKSHHLRLIEPKKIGTDGDAGLLETSPFEDLSRKLESKIHKIENDLKDSLSMLETDVNRLLHKNKTHYISKDIKKEINVLSNNLETRIKTSIENLIENSQSKFDQSELKHFKHLARQITKIMSFDFFKNVFEKLQKEERKVEVDCFGMDPVAIQSIKPFFDFLYYKYWRIETTGISNIPNEGKALIVSNHSGTLPYDGAMLATAIFNEHAVRKDARFLVEDFVYHMPFLGSFMYRIGGVRACPENAEYLLNNEHLVIVFPEGVKGIGKFYKERYKLQRFGRGGFVKLCIKTKSPLIPVGIVGAEEIHPTVFKSNILAKTIGIPYIPITPTFPLLGLLGVIPFPSKWSIHFGKPMTFDHYSPSILDDEIQIHKFSEKVRNEIQSILIELLKQRKSIWFG